jgi:hypothetical protein
LRSTELFPRQRPITPSRRTMLLFMELTPCAHRSQSRLSAQANQYAAEVRRHITSHNFVSHAKDFISGAPQL